MFIEDRYMLGLRIEAAGCDRALGDPTRQRRQRVQVLLGSSDGEMVEIEFARAENGCHSPS